MARIKMHIPKAKLPFYPPCEVKCKLQNGLSTLFVLTCSLPLVLCFFFSFFLFTVCFDPYPSTMPRKTRANRIPSTPSVSPSRS